MNTSTTPQEDPRKLEITENMMTRFIWPKEKLHTLG